MKTCDTCKWWITKDEHDQYTVPYDPDTYERMEMPFVVKLCGSPKLLFCERPIQEDGAAVADGSTYMANLITAAKFGCTSHEPLSP